MKKWCRQCEQDVRCADYYRHPKTADGLMAVCKACHRVNVKGNRDRNVEHYRAFDRARAMLPHRVELRAKYQSTPEGMAAVARAKKKYDASPAKLEAIRRHRAKHPGRYAARCAVGNAIRDGRLTRQPCEVCGNEKAQAHHDDYAKPLDVRWLCTTHHAEWHKHNTPLCPPQESKVA